MAPTPVRALAALSLLLAAAGPALADEVRALRMGDSMTGTVEAGIEEVVPFDAVEGTLVDIDLKMAPGSGPSVEVMQPDRVLLPGIAAYARVDAKSAVLKIKKLPLAQSGRHFLLVRPSVPGAYTATVKGKLLGKAVFEGFVIPDPPTEIGFGAVPGALLSITAKEQKGTGLSPKVLFVRAPGGSDVDLGAATSHVLGLHSDVYKGIPLPELGHYVLGMGTTTGIQGAPGIVQVTVKFPKVKKLKALEADLVVDPFVDQVQPSSGFDNLAYDDVLLSGDFFRDGATVTLVGPETIPVTGTARLDDATISFDLDLAGRTPGAYDVVVDYPNGAGATLAGAFSVLTTPKPTALLPTGGWDNRTQPFSVTGTLFQAGIAVAARPTGGGASIAGGVTSSSATQVDFTLALLDAPLGTFDIVVANVDGGTNVLPAALTVVRGPRFTGASPLLAFDNDAARAVTLAGNYFVAGMSCVLERAGQPSIASVVTGLAPTSATATFDLRNKASGDWTLRVTNPDGGTLTLGTPLTIARAPRPTSLAGGRFLDGEPVTGVSLNGTDFVSGAQVAFEIAATPTFAGTGEAVNVGGTQVLFDATASGVATGDHDLRVTNPDGGTALLGAAGTVLGTRTLTSSGSSAGRPAVAFNPIDLEFLAVYSVFDGSQRDVRAQRFSAISGKPVGNEILVTTGTLDASTTEDQTSPCVAFSSIPYAGPPSGTHHVYQVAYAWKDPNAAGNKVKVLSQVIRRDGTLEGDQTNALPLFAAASGAVDGPRIAWNSTRSEWLVVHGYDVSVSAAPDVMYTCLGNFTSDGTLFITTVASGTLIATTHTFSTMSGTATANDKDYDADVAWSSTRNEYMVVYTFDEVEAGQSPPPDSGIDVRARFFGPDFSTAPQVLASLNTLGDVASKNELHPRVASSGAAYLAAWDYPTGAGNRDVRCWLVNATTRAKIGASVTTVEQTASVDASQPALCWDATAGTTGFVVVYPLVAAGSGTSSVVAARFAQSGTAALGSPTYKTLAGTLANAAFDAVDAATRGNGGEFMAAWTVAGSAKAPADAEARFAK